MLLMHRDHGLRRRNVGRGDHLDRQEPQEGASRESAKEDTESVEWNLILANELEPDGIGISDRDLVLLASTALLNASYNLESEGVLQSTYSTIPTVDVFALHPKLCIACRALLNDVDMGGHAHAVMGKAFSAIKKHMLASHHFREAVTFRPDDWRLYEALADSKAFLTRHRQSLSALSVAERIVLVTDNQMGKYRIWLKKGQILFHLSRYREAIHDLEQALASYEQLKDQLTMRQIGEAAQAQFILCQLYIVHRKDKAKYDQHWRQAEEKLKSLPPSLTRQMNWKVRDTAEDALRAMGPRQTIIGFFCAMILSILVSFVFEVITFDKGGRVVL